MIEKQQNLANEETYVAEVQMAFQSEAKAAEFEDKLRTRKDKVFRYARPTGSCTATLTATSKNGDTALALLKKIREWVSDEIKSDTICYVIVGRVYHVLASYVASCV